MLTTFPSQSIKTNIVVDDKLSYLRESLRIGGWGLLFKLKFITLFKKYMLNP